MYQITGVNIIGHNTFVMGPDVLWKSIKVTDACSKCDVYLGE